MARLLENKGAAIIDADRIGHEVYRPGGPAYDRVVDRFGTQILRADGTVDRAALGKVAFSDPQARRDLDAITHPEITREMQHRIEELRDQDRVVVIDAALLVEGLLRAGGRGRGRGLPLDALVVVSSRVEDQIERMASDRGMADEDARARISAQAPQERKLAMADYVIDNRGTIQELERSIEVLWNDVMQRFGSKP